MEASGSKIFINQMRMHWKEVENVHSNFCERLGFAGYVSCGASEQDLYESVRVFAIPKLHFAFLEPYGNSARTVRYLE